MRYVHFLCLWEVLLAGVGWHGSWDMDYTGILDRDGRFGKEVRVPRRVRTRFQHDTFRQTRQAKEGRGLERKDWASTTCTPGVGGWMDGTAHVSAWGAHHDLLKTCI
jgi:hypothetical protein